MRGYNMQGVSVIKKKTNRYVPEGTFSTETAYISSFCGICDSI